MDGVMGLHSYIAQVDLERKHVIQELNRAKTQVPQISILHVVDPAEHSRVSGGVVDLLVILGIANAFEDEETEEEAEKTPNKRMFLQAP
ncbi:hypothetical protein MTR67_030972 [Solanum verrucosum]|uniref:Uncharacterized protein n=1 Tax=Solanum verrucosum TaxID=315347 RepID=A0AAF0U1M1_SOLVR|nr:hypothetical protein MTR67_030972 [Solanum verrucosum]